MLSAVFLLGGLSACQGGEVRPPPLLDVELVGVHFEESDGWRLLSASEDPMASHRPDTVNCPFLLGYFTYEGMEIDSSICNYLSMAKGVQWALKKGDRLNFHMRKDEFVPPPKETTAHFAISIGSDVVWEMSPALPGVAEEYMETAILEKDYPIETPLIVHIHNHGINTWTLFPIFLSAPAAPK